MACGLLRKGRLTPSPFPPGAPMKSKFPVLIAVTALGALALWYGTRNGSDTADGIHQEPLLAETLTVDNDGESAEDLVTELDVPVAAEGPSRESIGEAALGDGEEPEAALPTWDAADTVWVDVAILRPDGTPMGEEAYVFASSRQLSGQATFGDTGPIAALREGRDPRGVKGVLAAAPASDDGTARLGLPPDTTEAWIYMGGSYLYSLEPHHWKEASHWTEVSAAERVTLSPALGAWVAGVVRAPDGQTTAEGIRVTLDSSLNSRLELGSTSSQPLNRFTETDAAGRFHFYGTPAGRAVTVQTRSDTFARSFSDDLKLVEGERHDLVVTLAKGGTVHGRVVDDTGKAVEGAEVIALGQELFGTPTEELREVVSGEDGTFELTGLTPGNVWLKTEYEGAREQLSSPFEITDGERKKVDDIVLDRGLALSGVVTMPNGRPAIGAKVEVSPDLSENVSGSPMDPRTFIGGGNDADTDETGAFEIAGLGEGPWIVTAKYESPDESQPEDSGRWTASQALVRAPAEDLKLALDPPVNFMGAVVDSAGEPITAFNVKAELAGSQWYMPPSEKSQNGFESEDGRFVFSDLRPGKWTFTVTAKGMAPSEELEITLPTEEESTFVLLAPIFLAGKVVDPNGLPVSGAEISKELEGPEAIQAMQGRKDWATTMTDGEGLFTLNGVAPGAGSIAAKKDGWAPSDGYGYDLAEGEVAHEIVLVMRRGGTISGEVFGADGEPAAGCVLILQMPSLEERRFANADANGQFEETGLKPGSWQVQAFPGIKSLQPEGGGSIDQAALIKALKMTSVQLKDETTEHVVLGSPPAAPVRVYGVVSAGGDPVPDMVISFMKAEGGGLEGLKIGTTLEDGSYELVLDEPGDYLMTVQATGSPGMQNSVEFKRRIPETDDQELNVAMPMGRIVGRVVSADGEPSASARVTLSMQSGKAFGTLMGGQYNETRTDEDGQYEMRFVRPGDYVVAAGGSFLGGMLGGDNSLGRKVKSVTVTKDSSVTLDFKLESAGELHGTVRDMGGSPVADASIFLRDENGRLLELFAFQATNASGAFEYDGLAPGDYTISARAEGMASSPAAPVRVRSGEVSEATVTVDAGTTLLVSLTDKSGAELRSRVSVVDENGHEVNGMLSLDELMARVSGGVDGKVQRVGPLPPGRYKVSTTTEDGRTAKRTVRLSGDPEKKVRLRLK